jgi:hypothetical protein
MKTNKFFNRLRYLSQALFIFTALIFGANAATANDVSGSTAAKLSVEETYSIAAHGLTKKMEADLVLNGVKIKFAKVERYAISNSKIGLRGEGNCRLGADDNPLPIHFDVKINALNKSVDEINYNFVDAEETVDNAAMTAEETFVTRHLMEKIKADFKKENIVIALDYLNEVGNSVSSAKTFSGAGEVRIGDLVWKKISFEVVASDENYSAANSIKYQIQ